jgi:hypothetical protein
LGVLRLLDLVAGLNLGIDHLVFPRRVDGEGAYPPGETAPNTALDFVMCAS